MAIPKDIQEKIAEAKEKQLTELDLSGNFIGDDREKLTSIPTEVFELSQTNTKTSKLVNVTKDENDKYRLSEQKRNHCCIGAGIDSLQGDDG